MKWIEVNISVEPAFVEILEDVLDNCGVSGWQVIDYEEMRGFLENNPSKWDYIDDCVFANSTRFATVRFYAEDNTAGLAIVKSVEDGIDEHKSTAIDGSLQSVSITLELVDDLDWQNNWKKHYKPFTVGDRVLIVPSWEEPGIDYYLDSGRENESICGKLHGIGEEVVIETGERSLNKGMLVVRLDPGNAFGTGQHESTRLCIEALERYIKPGHMMLDLGCGSGILSVIGLLLGAAKCIAADINPDSAELAYRNAEFNGIPRERLSVFIGDAIKGPRLLDELLSQKYDCIAANIVADAIISLSEPIAKSGCLKPGGVFISSGIIRDRTDDVVLSLKTAGFRIERIDLTGEWASIAAMLLL